MIRINDDEIVTIMRALYFYQDVYTNQDPDYTDDAIVRSVISIRDRLSSELKDRAFLDGRV